MVAILILNWNGFEDTIECLKSLLASNNQDFFIIVGDNGSTNDSINNIERFLINDNIEYCKVVYGEDNLPNNLCKVVLCDLKVNNGFSRGNNMMLTLASRYLPDYYLFLNNDTEVEPNFLHLLVSFQREHKQFTILTPLIYYYSNKEKIWNAGGKLRFGFRKYYYGGSSDIRFNKGDFIECSFITGCALFVTPDILMENKKVFTERFFFGEEDFEFSMRQNLLKNKMACVCDSVIYHKVGSSSKNHSNLSKIYIHYLNRFIDMRLSFPNIKYILWKGIYVPYIYILLRKTYPSLICLKFLSLLVAESKRLDSVDKRYFDNIMSLDLLERLKV